MPFSPKGNFRGIQVQYRDQTLINVSMELSRDLGKGAENQNGNF